MAGIAEWPALVTLSSAATTSAALVGRFTGSFSRHCMTNDANDAGMSGLRSAMFSGASAMCAAISLCGDVAVKGGRPVSASYAMQPNEYKSA
jgi:hypothetical protein